MQAKGKLPSFVSNHRKIASARSSKVGLLVVDFSPTMIYANAEAIKILSYPESPKRIRLLNIFLAEKIQSILRNKRSSSASDFLTELMSGNRRYLCRAFSLNSPSNSNSRPRVAVLIERTFRRPLDLSQTAREFRLTPREQEALEFLMQGLTSKEIAARMKISPNTVKNFLRLVMIKTGVLTRTGIIGKIVETQVPIKPV